MEYLTIVEKPYNRYGMYWIRISETTFKVFKDRLSAEEYMNNLLANGYSYTDEA